MYLNTLLQALTTARVVGSSDVSFTGVTADSRAVAKGSLFVAVRGRSVDGHQFIDAAVKQGAAAIICEREISNCAVPQVVVPNSALALGVAVGAWHGFPAQGMTLIGVTGTNGKTTTTYLLESIIKAGGGNPGVIGTVTYRWAGQEIDAPYTTPTPEVLHSTLAAMKQAGCTHVIMEVSSAALAMGRLGGVEFAVAGFSNLTQDHLDVHGTMAAYRDAKELLFSQHLGQGTAVVNVDDEAAEHMVRSVEPARIVRVSTENADRAADVRIADCQSTVRGITGTVETRDHRFALEAKPLIGGYNVANLALATAMALAAKFSPAHISAGIAALRGVPGRVERVANDAGLDIFVDYAHTPDALINVLGALRPLTERRLICVFGCGGDRDPTKRPKMGAAVASLADLAVVTSDNPRTEAPQAIIDAILPAVPKPFFVSTDRRTAIAAAVCEATPGDVVLIAGKGHEDYQIIGTTKTHFDDREEAAKAVLQRPRWRVSDVARDAGASPEPGASDLYATRIVIDSRAIAPGDLYVAIVGERLDGNDFAVEALQKGAVAALVTSAGKAKLLAAGIAAHRIVEVDDTRVALGLLAKSYRQQWASTPHSLGKRVVAAITGSAGKTTTKELTRAAFTAAGPTAAPEGSLNNETGVPLTILRLRPYHQYAVLEMGMRGVGQIEYLTRIAAPDIAAVVNAGTAHIELLGSTDAIVTAKSEIWLGLREGGTIIAPADDDRLLVRARSHKHSLVTFGESSTADVRLQHYAAQSPTKAALRFVAQSATFEGSSTILGRHAAIDASCAIAIASAAGVPIATAVAGLARAKNAEMRGEVVEVAGRQIIVDCYNANPASTKAALALLAELAAPSGNPALAILGDMLELGEQSPALHEEVGAFAKSLNIAVIAVGKQAAALARGAGGALAQTENPAQAAEVALTHSHPGTWLLVKASRGMRLERTVEAMQAHVSSKEQH